MEPKTFPEMGKQKNGEVGQSPGLLVRREKLDLREVTSASQMEGRINRFLGGRLL